MKFSVVSQMGDGVQSVWEDWSGASSASLRFVSRSCALRIIFVTDGARTAQLVSNGGKSVVTEAHHVSSAVVALSMSITRLGVASFDRNAFRSLEIISRGTNLASLAVVTSSATTPDGTRSSVASSMIVAVAVSHRVHHGFRW